MGQPGFLDLEGRYRRPSENGASLVKLAALIAFETIRPKLATVLKRSDGSKRGHPPYDPVLTFTILLLRTLDTLSDDATGFQSRDRLSFMRFLGLCLEDGVPDAKTAWLCREPLTRAGVIEALFATSDGWARMRRRRETGDAVPRLTRSDSHRSLTSERPELRDRVGDMEGSAG